jgi:hypothetical protein
MFQARDIHYFLLLCPSANSALAPPVSASVKGLIHIAQLSHCLLWKDCSAASGMLGSSVLGGFPGTICFSFAELAHTREGVSLLRHNAIMIGFSVPPEGPCD